MIYISVILSGEVEEIMIVGYVKDLGLKDFWDWFMGSKVMSLPACETLIVKQVLIQEDLHMFCVA
jgi:hypothetical protein